jgi:hypothetical protein
LHRLRAGSERKGGFAIHGTRTSNWSILDTPGRIEFGTRSANRSASHAERGISAKKPDLDQETHFSHFRETHFKPYNVDLDAGLGIGRASRAKRRPS